MGPPGVGGGSVQGLTDDGAVGADTTTDPTDWTISYAQGGGTTSTLADLGRWADSMSGNRFLGSELQAARLATDTVAPAEPGSPQVPYQWGLGIYQVGDGWFGHDGEAIGRQAVALHSPDTGVSVAMAANTCAAESLVFMSILDELFPNQVVDDFITASLAADPRRRGVLPRGVRRTPRTRLGRPEVVCRRLPPIGSVRRSAARCGPARLRRRGDRRGTARRLPASRAS